MENKSHATAAGAFVVGVTLLLVAMTLWLIRDTSDRVPVDMVSAEAVSGLQPQALVRFRGVEVGVVTGIELSKDQPGHVLVHTMIDRTAPVTIKSFGTLGYQGVTGLAFIQLDTAEADLQAPRLQDVREEDKVVLPLSGGFISRLTDEGGHMMRQLQTTVERLNEVLNEHNQASLTKLLERTVESAEAVTKLANDTNQLLQTQFDPAKASLPKLVEDTQAAMADMRKAANIVGEAAANFNTTLTGFKAEGGPLDQFSDSAQAVTSDTLPRLNSTLESAERTLRQLNRTAQILNENPQAILYGPGAIPPGPGEAGFAAPRTQP